MIYATKLKELIYRQGYTLSKVNHEINKRNCTNKTVQNLSNKLSRETLKYTELLQILDIIGCEVEIKQKNNNT